MDFQVERFDEVSSTNDLVKERIDSGCDEGLVICSKTQNGGYGRRGNPWSSPEGGLYMSVLLRPNVEIADLPTLPHACAIAVRRAIASMLDDEKADCVKIKWPNDIVYLEDESADSVEAECVAAQDAESSKKSRPFQKMCGISVEQRNGAICLGIGVNVLRPAASDFDGRELAIDAADAASGRRSKNVPIYLEDLIPEHASLSPDVIGERILECIAEVYPLWQESLLAALRDEYMDHFALEGFKARIDESATTAIECEVIGINDRGNLEVIPLGENEVRTISAGTVRAL